MNKNFFRNLLTHPFKNKKSNNPDNFDLKQSLEDAKAEKVIDTRDFVIKSQKELVDHLKANKLLVYREPKYRRSDIPRVTEAEYNRLNSRINKITGYYKKIISFERKFDNMTITIDHLKKNEKRMMTLIEKLQDKTRHLPKKNYKALNKMQIDKK